MDAVGSLGSLIDSHPTPRAHSRWQAAVMELTVWVIGAEDITLRFGGRARDNRTAARRGAIVPGPRRDL
jgi:hypothetical protein